MEQGLLTKGLQVGYGKKILLDGVDISVEPGKVVALIGPNGSGKTTVLKTIIRQLKPLGGTIYIGDVELTKMQAREIAKTVSVVLTERIHTEYLSCFDVVASGRYPYTGALGLLTKEDEEKINEALLMVDAMDLIKQDFQKVSDGQKQRIMLARAICQEPEILILDEPTSYLDLRYKMDLFAGIRRLAREKNMAILLSVHELELAQKIADYILCLDGEKVVKQGTPEEIFFGDFLADLYKIPTDLLDTNTGMVYPKKGNSIAEKERVFVIGGGGEGFFTYYRLQREGIPFIAGILQENDTEFMAARSYAEEVISIPAFEEINQETLNRAKEAMDSCKACLCPLTKFGPLNRANEELFEYAKSQGKLEGERRE